ncbi:glycoside hydrolase family 20 zincin-like fold domain-containing protein [Streptomyces sp. NPDC052051]|uniref:glycoside hydrolase family 20 zincin-like fold domain-containing protein n=1 Tax=Streptomyces sp. NPDC052051 TaxID=3154649 RepID=UPI003437BD8A
MTGGRPFEITADTAVVVRHRAHEARRTAEYLAAWLRRATGHAVPVVTSGAAPHAITLADDETPSAEGYRLDVTHGGVHLRAAEPAGLFHATQTLRQLLPAAAMPIGTLTKKIQCQLTVCVKAPPARRPIEPPADWTKL